jgi:phytoene dehydrogenase-like protein
MFTKAGKVRSKYHTVVSQTNEVLKHVSADAEWRWADNPASAGKLRELLEALQAGLTTFDTEFLYSERKDLSTRYNEDQLLGYLGAFLRMEEALQKVADQHARLIRMHSSQ